jgi:proteasome lid subunit RPN8/RPN11
LVLGKGHWAAMKTHVMACLPFEACGLLAGTNAEVRMVFPISNQLRSTSRFRMEPSEQIRAFADMAARQIELLGIFHSHTAAPGSAGEAMAQPSATDIAEAAYPVVQVVWSRVRGPWEAQGYWIEGAQVAQVELEVRGDE